MLNLATTTPRVVSPKARITKLKAAEPDIDAAFVRKYKKLALLVRPIKLNEKMAVLNQANENLIEHVQALVEEYDDIGPDMY